MYAQETEENHPDKKSNTRNHLICTCGIKRKIIFSRRSRSLPRLHLREEFGFKGSLKVQM